MANGDMRSAKASKGWRAFDKADVLLLLACTVMAVPKGYGQQSPAAVDAAQHAYQEISQGNYASAESWFLKALAADPANADVRKDLGYLYERTGDIKKAVGQFEIVFKAHSEDLRTALELGYFSQRLRREDQAILYFQAATQSADPDVQSKARAALESLRAAQLSAIKQQGYDLIQQNRQADAIRALEEARRQDPQDYSVVLQLGYLYSEQGQKKKAEEMFRAASQSPEDGLASRARSALKVAQSSERLWFGDLYVAPFYGSRFDNEYGSFHGKIGLRPNRFFQPYVGARIDRDTRSETGRVPIIFSDNSAVFSVGIQSQPLKQNLLLYGEAGTAISLLGTAQHGRAIPDYRAGVNWFQPWGMDLATTARDNRHKAGLFSEAYSDISYYSRYGQNMIGYVQLKQGVSVPARGFVPFQLFLAENVVKDSRSDFYNNVVEAGPGLRFVPFRALRHAQVQAEYLRGYYLTDGHRTKNPSGPNYDDFRVFIIWGKYW